MKIIPTFAPSCRVLAIAFTLALAAMPAVSQAAPPSADDLAGSTWELVSFKYGDAADWENVAAGQRKMKFLTDTHYVWVEYDSNNGSVRGNGGGTYALKDGKYIEVVEFGGGNVGELRGKEQVFTFDLKGDRLEQSGTLSNGFFIGEIWQRVR